MIEWKTINHKIFENLAFDYMSSNYPDIRWEKTKLTNDGNKDGESIISSLPFDTTIKYWYEAKYSINKDKSISKSHLDSTLISSLLDGHVVVIAFITNAYISNDYIRRADIFARKRDNLKIYYINGEEIENWLSENPTIEDKYFHTISAQKYCMHCPAGCTLLPPCGRQRRGLRAGQRGGHLSARAVRYRRADRKAGAAAVQPQGHLPRRCAAAFHAGIPPTAV